MISDKEILEFKPEGENKLIIYTSQYRYSGPRRLDITAIKGSDLFRPNWEIVSAFKNGNMSEEEYEKVYRSMMQRSYKNYKDGWDRLLVCDYAVLVCFCKADTFCHRYLLADYLEKCGAKYEGEIPNV